MGLPLRQVQLMYGTPLELAPWLELHHLIISTPSCPWSVSKLFQKYEIQIRHSDALLKEQARSLLLSSPVYCSTTSDRFVQFTPKVISEQLLGRSSLVYTSYTLSSYISTCNADTCPDVFLTEKSFKRLRFSRSVYLLLFLKWQSHNLPTESIFIQGSGSLARLLGLLLILLVLWKIVLPRFLAVGLRKFSEETSA